MSSGPVEIQAREGLPGQPGELNAAALIREIERYLAAVALFCELGCQPTWTSEYAGA